MAQEANHLRPQYDPSGKSPVDANGCQIIDLGRTLFPEGPSGYRAVTPSHEFYFGLHEDPAEKYDGPQVMIVSYFGLKTPKTRDGYVLKTADEIFAAKRLVEAYILAHPRLFSDRPIRMVKFHDGPVQVREIF